MAMQTFTLGAPGIEATDLLSFFFPNPLPSSHLIDADFLTLGGVGYLYQLRVHAGTGQDDDQIFRVSLTQQAIGTDVGPEMTSDWEENSSAITLRAGSLSLVVPGPNSAEANQFNQEDTDEPYKWDLPEANRLEIQSFITSFSALSQAEKDATTLTLDDGVAPPERTSSVAVEIGAPSAVTTVSSRGVPLTLADWDGDGLEDDVLALIEAGPTDLFGQAPRPVSGTLLDGELGLGVNDVPITRISILDSGATVRMNDNDGSFHLGNYFSGDGNDLTVYFQTSAGVMSFPVDGNIANGAAARVNLDVPSGVQSFLNGISEDDRVIFALAREEVIERSGSTESETGAPATATTGVRAVPQERTGTVTAETEAPDVSAQANRAGLGDRAASSDTSLEAPQAAGTATRSDAQDRTASAEASLGPPSTAATAHRTGLGERPAATALELGSPETTSQGARTSPAQRSGSEDVETGAPTASAQATRTTIRSASAAQEIGYPGAEASGTRADPQSRPGSSAVAVGAPEVSVAANRFDSSLTKRVIEGALQLPEEWIEGGGEGWLRSITVHSSGRMEVALAVSSSADPADSGPNLTDDARERLVLTLTDSLSIMGISDNSEPYDWTPSNSSQVAAWFVANSSRANISVKVTLPAIGMALRVVTSQKKNVELADRIRALPRSAGVALEVVAAGAFGYDDAGSGFDQGHMIG